MGMFNLYLEWLLAEGSFFTKHDTQIGYNWNACPSSFDASRNGRLMTQQSIMSRVNFRDVLLRMVAQHDYSHYQSPMLYNRLKKWI